MYARFFLPVIVVECIVVNRGVEGHTAKREREHKGRHRADTAEWYGWFEWTDDG